MALPSTVWFSTCDRRSTRAWLRKSRCVQPTRAERVTGDKTAPSAMERRWGGSAGSVYPAVCSRPSSDLSAQRVIWTANSVLQDRGHRMSRQANHELPIHPGRRESHLRYARSARPRGGDVRTRRRCCRREGRATSPRAHVEPRPQHFADTRNNRFTWTQECLSHVARTIGQC